MQGFNRSNRKFFVKHQSHSYNDISICRHDGIYCPTLNLAYQQSIKAGESFPLYRGKKTRWLLVNKIKEFVLSNN